MRAIYLAKGGEYCALREDHPESDELTVVADFVSQMPNGQWQITHLGHVRRRDLTETDFALSE